MTSLKSAVVAFRVKNSMSRKAALDDAEMTVDDYVATPSDNYKFIANMNAAQSRRPRPRQRRHGSAGRDRRRRRPSNRIARGDLAEDVIEHKATGRGQRDARSVAPQMA